MSITTADESHPIVACAQQVRAAVKDVANVQPVFMTTTDKQSALVELARAEAQVAELRLRVLAASGEVGDEAGARDAAAWVAHATHADPRSTRADALLARRLDQRPLVAQGMREAQVSVAQARVIATVLEDLPDRLGAQVAADAEQTLVAFCDQFGPADLRRLARHLLDVIAPEVAEAELAKRLEDEERRALAEAFIKFHDRGDGSTRFWGLLPTTVTERLKRYLQAYTSPRARSTAATTTTPTPTTTPTTTAGGSDGAPPPAERVPQHRAYARAFSALLELLDPDQLPEHGGDATTVMVTITLDQLRTDLATAGLVGADEDDIISAAEARRLACTASIIPAVLGAKGHVLDLGRSQRLFNAAQRKATRLRDRRCRAEGCTIPAAWCELHHLKPWSEGGHTDLADATSLCSHHHHLVHDRNYHHNRLPNGDIRFHRRT